MQKRALSRRRLAALAAGASLCLGCLGLAGCGAKPGTPASVSTPQDVASTPLAAALSATAPVTTPTPAATAAATAPAPAAAADWLHSSTPWSGFQAQSTRPAGALNGAASASGDPLARWKLFTSPDGGFSVRMPGDPSPGVQSVPTAAGTLTLHTFLWQDETSAFYAGYADYPPALVQGANVKRLLDGARDGAIAMVHGTLIGEQDVTMAGMPARQVVIQASYPASLQTITVTARFGMAGNRQYQLQALSAGVPGPAESARIEAFFASFSLAQ